MKLDDFQKTIAHAVMRPLGAGESMRPENQAVAEALVKPNDRLDAFERLQIYNQQYWWRTLGALAEDFKGVAAVLGSRRFDALSVSYLNEIGSRSWNLGNLGQHLPEYVADHPAACGSFHALAIDMARTEWAKTVAFDAEERPPLEVESLMGASPAEIHLSLQPCLSLLELHHPTDQMLRRLKEANSHSPTQGASLQGKARRGPFRLSAKMRPQPIHLAVHRQQLLVYYKRLDPVAYLILNSLRRGDSLEQACAEASGSMDEAMIAQKISSWFQEWVEFGWLCKRNQ